MHKHILTHEMQALFPLLRAVRKSQYYLVGGTAIALHLGHRESIDYDFFIWDPFSLRRVTGILGRAKKTFSQLIVSRDDEVTGIIDEVKITFYYFPFPVDPTVDFEGIIKLPDLLSLAAIKAYALGRGSKWKDYVDLYFLLRDHFTVDEISAKAKDIFVGNFNPKLFREQLHYFEGIDYSEPVHYLIPSPPSDEEVREFLRVASLS